MTSLAAVLDEFANTGFGATFGLTITDYDLVRGVLYGSWEPEPSMRGPRGGVHHGMISGIVETMASLAANVEVQPTGDRVVGASNSTDVFREPGPGPLAVISERIADTGTQILRRVTVEPGADLPVAIGIVRLHRLKAA